MIRPISLNIDTIFIMIDWITGKFPFYFKGLLTDGEFLSISADGAIETRTLKRKIITGSYASNITIRTFNVDENRNTCEVELSGNPAKFMQGHNLFGTLDAVNLIYSTLERISSLLGVEQPIQFYNAWKAASGIISRVDINTMYSLGSRSDCLQWLHSASSSSRTRSQSAVTRGSTVYWNRESRRWSLKAYSKGQELELPRNNKQGLIELNKPVLDWANDKLRIELTLKSNELRHHNLHTLREFAKVEPLDLLDEYMEKMTISDQLELEIDVLQTLRGALKGTYSAWLAGIDCRSTMSKPTFYRHRKELLKYGIDISISKPVSNVVPFVRTITMTPAAVPDWAIGTDLYFEPPKRFIL